MLLFFLTKMFVFIVFTNHCSHLINPILKHSSLIKPGDFKDDFNKHYLTKNRLKKKVVYYILKSFLLFSSIINDWNAIITAHDELILLIHSFCFFTMCRMHWMSLCQINKCTCNIMQSSMRGLATELWDLRIDKVNRTKLFPVLYCGI